MSIIKSIRKTWGDMNPVTRVIRDRTKFSRKVKHKNKSNE